MSRLSLLRFAVPVEGLMVAIRQLPLPRTPRPSPDLPQALLSFAFGPFCSDVAFLNSILPTRLKVSSSDPIIQLHLSE